MSSALLPLLASLATAIGLDAGLDLRAESRTSTVAQEGFGPETREALRTRPRAELVVDAVPVRLSATYSATIWTSDVEARPSPLVTQDAAVRVETRHASLWRARAAVSAARGWTDPLADPVQALAREGLAQYPTLQPIEFEALRGEADGTFPLDHRTTLLADASASRSGAAAVLDRASLPTQDAAFARLALEYLWSARNTLRLTATASATQTELSTGNDQSGWAAAMARSRVRLTRTLDGWGGAGVGASRRDPPDAPPSSGLQPLGELGIAYDSGRLAADLSAQTIPFTDRFDGAVVLLYQTTATLRWRETPRLSFLVAGSGGTTRSGDTALASLDARATYVMGEQLSAEAAIVGRWQHEAVSSAPSFAEVGILLALTWTSRPPRP